MPKLRRVGWSPAGVLSPQPQAHLRAPGQRELHGPYICAGVSECVSTDVCPCPRVLVCVCVVFSQKGGE